jgi:hypothetical protein
VYNPALVLPRFIVHFRRVPLPSPTAVPRDTTRLPKHVEGDVRWYDITREQALNPGMGGFDWLVSDFHFASSIFHTLSGGTTNVEVTKVTVCVNPRLDAAFVAAQRQLHARDLPSAETGAFHGTNVDNIRAIQRDGFLIGGLGSGTIANGTAMGYGVYVGTTADVSMRYVRGESCMLVVRALPGKTSQSPLTLSDCSIDDRAVRDGVAQSYRNTNPGAIVLASPVLVLPRYAVHWAPKALR